MFPTWEDALVPAHMPSSSSLLRGIVIFEIHVVEELDLPKLFSQVSERLTEDAVSSLNRCSCPAGCISCLGEKAGVKPDTRINALKLLHSWRSGLHSDSHDEQTVGEDNLAPFTRHNDEP